MGFQKISSLSLTDLFVQQIENMILSGELAVGEQLPPARKTQRRKPFSSFTSWRFYPGMCCCR